MMAMKHIKKSCWLAAAVLLAFMAVIFAENGVTVTGTIVHSNNSPAVNVYVSIAGVGRYTGIEGRFRLDGVPLGQQKIRVEDPRQPGRVLLDTSVEIHDPMAPINQSIP
jgi:hypothetical protein